MMVGRLPLLGAALGRDERAEQDPRARLRMGASLRAANGIPTREHEAGEEGAQHRPAVEPELLPDARQERGPDEHGAMVHVRLVALERVDLRAHQEQRREGQQDAHGPARHAARAGGDADERRPHHEPDHDAAGVEQEVGALEGEDPGMPLREVHREDARRRREQERTARPAAEARCRLWRQASLPGDAAGGGGRGGGGVRHGLRRNIHKPRQFWAWSRYLRSFACVYI